MKLLSYMLLICTLIIMITFMMKKMEKWDKNLATSFECGFTPYFYSRCSFSMHYFTISLMFLFLDLELVLTLPFFLMMTNSWKKMNMLYLFIMMIVVTIIYEWKEGKMEWKF